MIAVTFDVNGSSVQADRSARRLSDMLRDELEEPHGDQGGMRRGRLRRVYGPARRGARERVHDAGGASRRPEG